MQNPSYNVSDCPLFHHFHWLVLSLFLRLFQSYSSHIATNYCPMYFLLDNSSVQQQPRMINVPWDCMACYIRPLYSYLVFLPTLPNVGFSLYLPPLGFFVCICLCQAFLCICLLWAFLCICSLLRLVLLCSMLAGYAVLSCSLCGPWGLLECCVCWVPWVCLFLKLGYAGYGL